MKTPYFTVKNIIQITGITKRALHYYDKTNLLKPSKVEDNGYRYYDQEALGNLQMIQLFKEMNFSLKDIATMMQLSKDEQKEILRELEQFMVCDAEILRCIAEAYTTDRRYVGYFNQFGDEDFLSFLYQAIMVFVKGEEV